jgi:hypothetical protein
LFLKNFQRFKKNKTPDTQARQKSTRQMTRTNDIKMVVTHDRQVTTAYNTSLAKAAVQCSTDTFTHLLIVLNGIRDSLRLIVVNQSLVLRINICAKNPHLRQARKR